MEMIIYETFKTENQKFEMERNTKKCILIC